MSDVNEFDFKKLTMGEVATVEKLSGVSIRQLNSDETPQALVTAAMAYVWKRRTERSFSWADAQGLTMSEANEILGFDEDEDEDEESPKEILSA